tara:strand:+ start:2154 stop:2966 length:813 start_codon:yes stop_codon:yes gene_type:complete
MKICYFIFTLFVSSLLFSESVNEQLINDNPAEISLMDTRDLDPKLKLFLDKYYQKNYSDDEYIKTVKSMQLMGAYTVNGGGIGNIKIIKKRPNKYKSYIKKNNDSEQIIIYDGASLKSGRTTNSDPTIQWQPLDIYASENLWIHYEQIFDSLLLNPKDPKKEISLGISFMEDGQVIQPVKIILKNDIKMTYFVPIRNNLTKKILVEFNERDHSAYRSYTIHLANYESINGMMFPKKISTQLSGDHIVDIEISDIQFNLGISDFFFKAIPF